MNNRNILIVVFAVVFIAGVVLLPKYFDYRNFLKQEVEESLPVQKTISENFSLPPPPATSTVINTTKLPKPLSSLEQQKAAKKITLPPPPAE
jgi:hypothetical protein